MGDFLFSVPSRLPLPLPLTDWILYRGASACCCTSVSLWFREAWRGLVWENDLTLRCCVEGVRFRPRPVPSRYVHLNFLMIPLCVQENTSKWDWSRCCFRPRIIFIFVLPRPVHKNKPARFQMKEPDRWWFHLLSETATSKRRLSVDCCFTVPGSVPSGIDWNEGFGAF